MAFGGLKLGLGSLDLGDESRREVELASRLDDDLMRMWLYLFLSSSGISHGRDVWQRLAYSTEKVLPLRRTAFWKERTARR